MKTLSYLILTLILCSLLLIGCQTASTNTPPAEQPLLNPVISSGNVSQLKQIAALELPESMLNTLVFSPDSRTLISGDASGEVNFWERETWEKTAFLAPQSGFKRDADGKANFNANMALSPSGQLFVTSNMNNEVIGVDLSGKEQFSIPFGEQIQEVEISSGDKYLAVGSYSNKLIVYNLETNQQIADLSSDYERTSNLVFSPDGKILLVSYERPENVMKTWDTATWQEIATFSHTTGNLDYHDILFTPDGKSLVIVSTNNDIELFDLNSKQVIQNLQGHTRGSYQIAFSPDGSLLASASDDMTLRLWNVKTGKALLVLRNRYEVGSVTFSPDGTMLAFGVWGEGLQVWALDSAAASAPPATTAPTVSSATAPSSDSTVISTATISQIELQTTLSGHTGYVTSLAFSSDGSLLASSAGNNEIKLWDLNTRQEVKTFSRNGGWDIFFLANDQQLATNHGEAWDIESGEIVHAAMANNTQCSFSDDGGWMVSVPSNKPIELWDTSTWQKVKTLEKHSDAVNGMAFSADNSILATGSARGPDGIADISVKLWSVAEGTELFTLEGHLSDIHAVAFSPDESMLASGGIDPTVKIWDVKSGQLIRSLQSGEGVMDVIISPDGSLVASAGSDGTVKIWDLVNGSLLKTLTHPDELMAVAFSPDGTVLATGGYENSIYLWGISD